jgi:hypothetical protein
LDGVMPKKRVLLASVGLFALNGLAYADSVDFNTPGDLSGKFTINNQTGAAGTGFSQMSSGGVGNSGGVDVTAGPSNTLDATAIYNVRSFNPADGPITISQFVKVLPAPYANGDRLLHLGLIDDLAANHQLNGGAPAVADFISARMSPTAATVAGATTGPFAFQVQVAQSTAGAATATDNNTQGAPVNLILGDWYQFSIDITKTGTPNVFSVGGRLQDFGADGLTPGTVFTFPAENNILTNARSTDIYNDTTVYGAFRGHAAGGGADMYDNFSITQAVPEPASFGIFGLAALAMGARRKRK